MAGRRSHITWRYAYFRHWYAVEAECTVALLTEKVYMQVIVVIAAMTVTKLISQRAGAVLDGVYEMVLTEERQSTEDARLVN